MAITEAMMNDAASWFGVIYEGDLGDLAYHACVFRGHGYQLVHKRFPFRNKDCHERMLAWFEEHKVVGVYEAR